MDYFIVEPEVAGGFGPNTIIDRSADPPRVVDLEYVFDGWLGDVLLESTPCFIATEKAVAALEGAGATGVSFGPVKVGISEEFKDLHPGRQLPSFRRLHISGTPGHDDFALAPDLRLVASARALNILREFGLAHADITAWRS